MTTSLSPERFAAAFTAVAAHVADRHGVPTTVAPLTPPFRGDLDGARIVIAPDTDAETRLFLVAHLFGHTVQWNTSAAARRLGGRLYQRPGPAVLAALERYEREACGYSLSVLHEAGVTDLDQWLADHAACDLAYLRHFYLTGERAEFRRFWREGTPPLVPLPIPDFRPRRWRRRIPGIVV